MGGTSFQNSPKYLYSSESVTEGHPDKVCDQISDAVLDAIYAQDPNARVACEAVVSTDLVVVLGEITTTAKVDIPALVKEKVKSIGYDKAGDGFDYHTCRVLVEVHEQSPEISKAVTTALEKRNSKSPSNEDEVEALGAGDQGMMVGYASNETAELMPLPIALAHQLARQLSLVRKEGALPYLRPDGKSQVTIEYAYGKPKRVHTVVVSSHHEASVDQETIARDIKKHVIDPVIAPTNLADDDTRVFVNPSGSFVVGGPTGDTGLTGRKLLVDTYGGMARHGGGAFSGKDPTKVDRSGAYAARYVAKNVVAAGLADQCEIQVAYAIGVAQPISICVETFGTGHVPDEVIVGLVHKHFDLRPGAIIHDLQLRRPIYQQTASYGHFGRDDVDLPWERTDKAAILRADAKL